MRFWRHRRNPPPVLLPPLERLAELVERVVALLDVAPASTPEPEAAERPEEPEAPAQREDGEEVAAGHLILVTSPDGYRLLPRDGPAPAGGDVVELEDARYRVLRLGPSPLPGDRRRCAFMEQEPPPEERTPMGARGEPDRRDEGGDPG